MKAIFGNLHFFAILTSQFGNASQFGKTLASKIPSMQWK